MRKPNETIAAYEFKLPLNSIKEELAAFQFYPGVGRLLNKVSYEEAPPRSSNS